MVMNKKGFLKILEAIISIIIVFSFIIAVIPVSRDTGSVPDDLQLTMDAIIKQAQNDNHFRKCVLGGSIEVGSETKHGAECINEFIKKNSPPLFPWGHGIRLCSINQNGFLVDCEYGKGDSTSEGKCDPGNSGVLCEDCNGVSGPGSSEIENEKKKCFLDTKLPADRNIFTRAVSLSVDDISVPPLKPPESLGESKSLTLYFWFKV